jgi:hypothetical protein
LNDALGAENLAPLFSLGPFWIMFLGFRFWVPGSRVIIMARRTHYAAVVIAGVLIVHGWLAIRAAEKSAEGGGGLLGGYGLIPILYGVLLGAVSMTTLAMTRSR